MYAQKFQKQTKKWDATPIKERKKYRYIPDLVKEIETMRTSSPHPNVKQKRSLPFDHPARFQPTIGILFQTIKYLLLDLRSLVFSETNKIN